MAPVTDEVSRSQSERSSDASLPQEKGPLEITNEVTAQSKGLHKRATTFAPAADVRFYKPIDTYEGIHRWDPDFEWDEKEEKRLVRKVTMLQP